MKCATHYLQNKLRIRMRFSPLRDKILEILDSRSGSRLAPLMIAVVRPSKISLRGDYYPRRSGP